VTKLDWDKAGRYRGGDNAPKQPDSADLGMENYLNFYPRLDFQSGGNQADIHPELNLLWFYPDRQCINSPAF